MIAHIVGRIVYSDAKEIIVQTDNGVGYQIFYEKKLSCHSKINLFISQIFRETSQELYGFLEIKEKKLFEILLRVKGVGAKSAYALVVTLGSQQLLEAILFKRKKILMEAPGIGEKAASLIILELFRKIKKLESFMGDQEMISSRGNHSRIISDTLEACDELGFSELQVLPLIDAILQRSHIDKSEQLLRLVLEEI